MFTPRQLIIIFEENKIVEIAQQELKATAKASEELISIVELSL